MNTAVDMLRCSLCPDMYNTMPPSFCSQTTFSKRLDVIGNFTIVADSTLTGERVPTSTGAIIWQPSRGVGSVYRYGIVPVQTIGVSAAIIFNWGGGGSAMFRYTTPLPVPYGTSLHIDDTIVLSPPLDETTISQARLYAAKLSLNCDSVGTGATVLNGYLSGASVGDVRDVFQQYPVTFAAGIPTGQPGGYTLDIAHLVQAACTVKDAVKEVSGYKGVTALVGPDISLDYTAPDVVDTIYEQHGTMAGNYIINTGFATAGTLVAGAYQLMALAWVSPWNIQEVTAGLPAGITEANINPGPINPAAGAYKLHLEIYTTVPATASTGSVESWQVWANHLYATVRGDGSLNYNYGFEQVNQVAPSNSSGFSTWDADYDFDAKMFMTGGYSGANPDLNGAESVAGMYLGTQISIVVMNVGPVDNATASGQLASYTLQVISVDDYAPHALGPTTVLRWDGFTVTDPQTQIMKVDGTFLAQCVPGVTSAPFVQSAGNGTRACDNLNALPFLAQCYNADATPYKRVWVDCDYREFCRQEVPRICASTIRRLNIPRLTSVAMASGVLRQVSLEDVEEVVSNDGGDPVTYAPKFHLKRTRNEDDMQSVCGSIRSAAPVRTPQGGVILSTEEVVNGGRRGESAVMARTMEPSNTYANTTVGSRLADLDEMLSGKVGCHATRLGYAQRDNSMGMQDAGMTYNSLF